jgi:hypothetical protein
MNFGTRWIFRKWDGEHDVTHDPGSKPDQKYNRLVQREGTGRQGVVVKFMTVFVAEKDSACFWLGLCLCRLSDLL